MEGESIPDIQRLPLASLDFDRRNPRLLRMRPAEGELTDAEIARNLIEAWDPKPIGRSLAEYGFFPSEPLIVFPVDDRFVVAEGNRRLLAARLLTDEALRSGASADASWTGLADKLAGTNFDLSEVPCQVVPDRDAAAPTIGYRHIVGIAKWEAYDKAAFVANLIQDGNRDFETVSDLVGEGVVRVKRYLRDFLAVKQAEEAAVEVGDVKDSFGRFERSMTTAGVREFIEAKRPAEMDADDQESVGDIDSLRKLLGYLYGLPDGTGPLFTDTRRIDELATALRSAEGREILESERDLDRAFDASGGRRGLVLKGLEKALNSLASVAADFPDYADDAEVVAQTQAVRDALEQLPTGETTVEVTNEEEYDLASEEEYEAEAEDEE